MNLIKNKVCSLKGTVKEKAKQDRKKISANHVFDKEHI